MHINATTAKMLIAWVALLSIARTGAASDLRVVEAVKNRDKEAVRALLDEKADVNTPQRDGATALHWAVHWDDLETAELLVRAGARVNVANDYEVKPLSLACTNGNAAMAEMLLRAGADPNATLRTGETALMTAARTGNVDVVEALVARGAYVNAREMVQGHGALMWAAAEGHAEVARVLLEHGADVHARSSVGFTALMLAGRKGDLQTTRVLLAAGADVNKATPDGATALLIGTIRGHIEYAALLLGRGANPNMGPGFTPLHWAAGEWPTELTGADNGITVEDNEWAPLGGLRGQAKLAFAKLLLEHHADPNAQATARPGYVHVRHANFGPGWAARRGGNGMTPFLMGAKAGDADVMRVLWAAGADPLAVTSQKATALMLAAGLQHSVEYWAPESGYLEAVKVALDLGVDINAVNAAGETALYWAAFHGRETIVQFLVDDGANLNVKNRYGWTALTVAEGVSNNVPTSSVAELLRKAGADSAPPEVSRRRPGR